MGRYNEVLLNVIDEQFPKGDKARGRALVIIALAHREIDLAEIRVMREFKEESGLILKQQLKQKLKEKVMGSKDDWITTLHRELKEEMIDSL